VSSTATTASHLTSLAALTPALTRNDVTLSVAARAAWQRVSSCSPPTGSARSFMVAFPDMQVLMDDLRLDGGSTQYHWTLVGTNTGPGGTGRRVRISGFEEWTIGEDGLIAASLGHFDEAEYARQLEHGVDS